MTQNELYHYGVLGMKWGVRRTPAQLARARGERSSKTSSISVKKKEPTKESTTKKLSEMSDDELRNTVRRLQLEKQYKDLNPEKVSIGKKFVNTVSKQIIAPTMVEATKTVLRPYIEDAMRKPIEKAVKRK